MSLIKLQYLFRKMHPKEFLVLREEISLNYIQPFYKTSSQYFKFVSEKYES